MQPTKMPMYQPGLMQQPFLQQPGLVQQPAMVPQPGMTGAAPGGFQVGAPAVAEESYIENILRFNKGKIGTFYYTVEGSKEWNSVVFRGRVETAGRDHIILSDPKTGRRFLLLMVNLSWAEFEEPINYPNIPVPQQVKAILTDGDMPTFPSARNEQSQG
ncbi:spore germination protein Q [Tumebacillus sp. BK434]|uniref:spore coat protein GerQ n=1 Tax=Tumebacillus sp. BK434 TaxID=2512169 RepID=UPI00104BA8A6|nr:spore coat protein GerQ [Tumebacillus sp. BK434]TCP52121.1 spore germination protein Q [Tumebacillus sp. BK434]